MNTAMGLVAGHMCLLGDGPARGCIDVRQGKTLRSKDPTRLTGKARLHKSFYPAVTFSRILWPGAGTQASQSHPAH
jgi:hypothetical protein